MKALLEFAMMLHVKSHVNSELESTRHFWRRRLQMPEEVVLDPRPLVEALDAYAKRQETT